MFGARRRRKEREQALLRKIEKLQKEIISLTASNLTQSKKIAEMIFVSQNAAQFKVLDKVRDYLITNVEAVHPTLSTITAAAQLTVNLLYIAYYVIEKKPLPKSIQKQCEEFITGWHYEYTVMHVPTLEKSLKKESELIALK